LIAQEAIHRGRPERDPARKQRMAVVAKWRDIDELGAPAGAVKAVCIRRTSSGPKNLSFCT
jgi:hypothetical protein